MFLIVGIVGIIGTEPLEPITSPECRKGTLGMGGNLCLLSIPQGTQNQKKVGIKSLADACLKTSSAPARGIFPDAIFWEFKKS
jgi:hypothetical protein